LPKLEFAALDRLRTREESLRLRSRFSDVFEPQPRDSWARFSHELRGIGSALSRWAAPKPEKESGRPQLVRNSASGFTIYIEWMSPPERDLLISPPIPDLWNLDPDDLIEPITLIFTVNPQGKVTEIQFPLEDEAGVIASIGQTLLKYRFKPLTDKDAPQEQRGLLLVAPAQLKE